MDEEEEEGKEADEEKEEEEEEKEEDEDAPKWPPRWPNTLITLLSLPASVHYMCLFLQFPVRSHGQDF